MTGWQWHQLDHMQIICTTLQTDNHASTPSINFLRAGCSSWRPASTIKALKAVYKDNSGQNDWPITIVEINDLTTTSKTLQTIIIQGIHQISFKYLPNCRKPMVRAQNRTAIRLSVHMSRLLECTAQHAHVQQPWGTYRFATWYLVSLLIMNG